MFRILIISAVLFVCASALAQNTLQGAGLRDGEGFVRSDEVKMFPAMEPGWQHRLMFYDPRAGVILDEIQRSLSLELGGKDLMAPELLDGLLASGFFAFDAFPSIARLTMPTVVLVGRVDSEMGDIA